MNICLAAAKSAGSNAPNEIWIIRDTFVTNMAGSRRNELMPLTSEIIIFFFFLWKRKFGKCRRLFFGLNQISVGLFGCLDRWRALLRLLYQLLERLSIFRSNWLSRSDLISGWKNASNSNNKYDTRTGQGTAVDKSEHNSRIELSRRGWGDHSLFRLYWYFYFWNSTRKDTN